MSKIDKKFVRKTISIKRDSLNQNEKTIYDKKIIQYFIELEEYKKAENICIYVSFKSEINTREIIEIALRDRKNIYVPRVKKNREMEFIKINSLRDLEKNKMGILEPKLNLTELVEKVDINVLPGLAFDLERGRIGYGGGYYDRYFQNINCLNVSLCYEIQIIEKIPMEKHDIKYDYLISEKGILKKI
ncbi:5-formyltetrahydrofolate cyclo-ligase [uncultured Clostridium sp.]|uniref:5-formyltetrahydrofolate cyclo-ligase n=1 Tax=uncultured Clostridium sp. TaxID=59620 RepID=UPI002627945C|nr:5-formyltetrahydrofolate cyclo-ligase [uncultured Clostridium sp.]